MLLAGACFTESSQSAATIDHLATYYFSNQDKDWPAIHALKAHLSMQPDMLPTLLGVLFNALLFGPAANHWQITRPVLSLISKCIIDLPPTIDRCVPVA